MEENENLLTAIRNGDIDGVKSALKNGADVDTVDMKSISSQQSLSTHNTPLHLATKLCDDAGIVELLLMNNANPNALDNFKRIPLHWAAMKGHIEMVQLFLQYKANHNALDESRRNPLHFAIFNRHIEVIRCLLSKGTNAEIIDDFQKSPLLAAVMFADAKVVEVLLEHLASSGKLKSIQVSSFIHAAFAGDTKMVQAFLKCGVNPNITNSDGNTPLHYAAREGHIDTIQLLLSQGAVATIKNKKGEFPMDLVKNNNSKRETIRQVFSDQSKKEIKEKATKENEKLITAIKNGDIEGVKSALENGADVETIHAEPILRMHAFSRRNTPLHLAIKFSNGPEIVQLLLENKANPNGLDSFKRIPLHWVDNLKVAQLLLDYGANPNVVDPYGHDPLFEAMSKRHLDIARYILSHGADIGRFDYCHKDNNLRKAVVHRSTEAVRMLLEHIAKIGDVKSIPVDPFIYAACSGNKQKMQLYLDYTGAHPNTTAKDNGNTLLHYACREGKIDAVHFLLSKGASPTIRNKEGLTPMDLVPSKHPKRSEILNLLSEHTLLRPEIIKAAEKGDIEGVKTALTNGDEVDTPDKTNYNWTPLCYSVSNGHTDVALLLLQADADPNYVTDFHQQTPLHDGISKGHNEMVELLLQYAADPNASDEYGNTSLHVACKEGHVNIVHSLLSQGADPSAKNNEGKTPLEECQNRNRDNILHVFAEYNPKRVLDEVSEWGVENFDEEQIFEKPKQGFMVIVPPSSVKKGQQVKIQVKHLAPEQSEVEIPENLVPLGLFYKLEMIGTFLKPIQLCLQHNVDVSSKSESDQLAYIKAKNSYKFFLQSDGKFTHDDNSGLVPVSESSVIGICSRSPQLACNFRYALTLCFKLMEKLRWQVKAVITKDMEPFNEDVKSKNCFKDWTMRDPISFYFDPDVNEVTLSLDDEYYDIKSMKANLVAKDVVDQATLGSSLLYLHFTIKPKDPQKLTDLELTFNGMRDEKTLVITSYELQQIQDHPVKSATSTSTSMSTKPLPKIDVPSEILDKVPKSNHLMRLLHKLRFKWDEIGRQLAINPYEIENAKRESGLFENTDKLSYILRKWNDQRPCPVCWKKIMSVIEDPPIEDETVAYEMREFLAREEIRDEYISPDHKEKSGKSFTFPSAKPVQSRHYEDLSQTLADWQSLLITWHHLSSHYQKLIPATVCVDNLTVDLENLQNEFAKDVYDPLMSKKTTFTSLSDKCHLLPNKENPEEIIYEFKLLIEKAEETHSELSGVIDDVHFWWSEVIDVKVKVTNLRGRLTKALPLSGTISIVQKQDDHMQAVLLKIKEYNPKCQRSIKNLSSVASHSTLLIPDPINLFRDELQTNWQELYKQAVQVCELVEKGFVRLTAYLECGDPFDSWLGKAEETLVQWNRVDYQQKDVLMKETETIKAFKLDVKQHSHDIRKCENIGNKFLKTTKKHQALLLSYKCKSSSDMHKDSEGEQLMVSSLNKGDQAQSEVYNGLQVISVDLQAKKKRYHKLTTRTARRAQKYEEALQKRLAFENALQALLPKLEETETKIKSSGIGQSSVKSLQEQAETMKALDSEFSILHSLMDNVQMTVAAWSVREPTDSEAEEDQEEEDTCVTRKDKAQRHYDEIQESLKCLQKELKSSLAEAEAFESAHASFIIWLKDTETKVQRDNQLKLEVTDLKGGLTYLKSVSADIAAHEKDYRSMCNQFCTLLEFEDNSKNKEDTRKKLENLETSWSGLQLIQEDVDVIANIIPLLESFYSSYHPLAINADHLLEKLAQHSCTTTTSEEAEKKMVELKGFVKEYEALQNEFDMLLSQNNKLLEAPFEQTHFQADIQSMEETLMQCKQMTDEIYKSLKDANDLHQNVIDVVSWIKETDAAFDKMAPPAYDSEELQKQIKEQENLKQKMSKQQPKYDQILEADSSLHKIAQFRVGPTLQNQLQKVKEKWPELKAKMNERSELLANHLMEVIGLQQASEQMTKWVEKAEKNLSTSIADDLETVKKQLSEYKSFQEEMSSYQPNMDSLSKAAEQRKKGRDITSSLPSSLDIINIIDQLCERWQKLQERSSEYHCQLIKKSTQLNEIALTRSFDFEAFCKMFNDWMKEKELNINDLFDHFDKNHDGKLMKHELKKALRASGYDIKEIEIEKIADNFFRNKSGQIKLTDIKSILTGQKQRKKSAASSEFKKSVDEVEHIDTKIQKQIKKCTCDHDHKFKITKDETCSGGVMYRFGDSKFRRLVRILHSNVMVRVGGGWEKLETFLEKHDPCRALGRRNTDLRLSLAGEPRTLNNEEDNQPSNIAPSMNTLQVPSTSTVRGRTSPNSQMSRIPIPTNSKSSFYSRERLH